jgi:hypothetical protein
MKKNGGRKSRDRVPLRHFFSPLLCGSSRKAPYYYTGQAARKNTEKSKPDFCFIISVADRIPIQTGPAVRCGFDEHVVFFHH